MFLLSFLVTLQQALSSGYINSVITTIEKRFEIPSSLSGLIASSYEIGNVITVIFVSYLGSRRHIPVWIGYGKYFFIDSIMQRVHIQILRSSMTIICFAFFRFRNHGLSLDDICATALYGRSKSYNRCK